MIEENQEVTNNSRETKVVHVYEPADAVPEEVKGWNWGAFGLTFFWSIGNKAYLGLLILLSMVPWVGWIFAIIWKIVVGMKGNEWAWKNGEFHSVEEFKKVQESWKAPGIISFALSIVGIVLVILLTIIFFGMAATYGEY